MYRRFRMLLALLIVLMICLSSNSNAQLEYGIGLTAGTDFYQRQVNPGDEISKKRRSSGNILLNPSIGPKLWLGNPVFSFSVEAQVNFGITSLDVNEYKGMGALSFPVMGAFNFEGLSGLEALGVFGLSVGGGVEFCRTELFLQPEEHQAVDRGFFPVYFGQVNLGIGFNGVASYLYVRLGYGEDESRVLHIGIMTDLNLRRVDAPLSKLKNLPFPK